MALGVEFASVVVQIAQADRTLPGGLSEFAPTQYNYIEDEHLFRVGFMSAGEAGALVDNLLSLGLHPEAVTVEQMTEPLPAWLERGGIDGHRAVWLAGHAPGKLVPPLQSVMLRGSALLRDTINSMHTAGEINIRDLEADETANDLGAARLEVTQGNALVDLYLMERHDADAVGLWAMRRQERNRRCRTDIILLELLRTTLEATGATS